MKKANIFIVAMIGILLTGCGEGAAVKETGAVSDDSSEVEEMEIKENDIQETIEEASQEQAGYFVAGDTINFKNGLSVYVIKTEYIGYMDAMDTNCVYMEIEATNNGKEDVYLPVPDFYGDDYSLKRVFGGDAANELVKGTYIAPGRKVHGGSYADMGANDYSVVEAQLYDAKIRVLNPEASTSDSTIYGTYSYDNGVDAIMDGEVGFYTDSDEDYVYLAALYYDSSHYSAEVQGTLQSISENTFSVKDEITGSVELEVTFTNGGMDVKVTETESDEYKVLEGHYDMIKANSQ